MAGGSIAHADRLILEAATGTRPLTRDELRQVAEHVALAGFRPGTASPARGLSGLEWQGRTLHRSDRISAAERHYLRHAVVRQEWPLGTSLTDYIESIRYMVQDDRSGVFTSRYRGRQQVGFVRWSPELQGPDGSAWVLVEYRVGVGHWVTAYQPQEGLRALRSTEREDLRWLQQPRT